MNRRRFLRVGASVGAGGASLGVLGDYARAATSVVREENARAGTPRSVWWPGRDPSIVGFPVEFSVAPGDLQAFKIATDSTSYRVVIYRMGWYGGDGARRVADLAPEIELPQAQPDPLRDEATRLVDCSNWEVSVRWTIPEDAVSGVYLAAFERLDRPGLANHTWFVVRRDTPSDIAVQTSEMTWHAYNRFGGASLYWSTDGPFADRVSYQRPFDIDGIDNEFLTAEYPLVRWLERNGYDVAYLANLDTHRFPAQILNRKVFISSGHDEYWSGPMRAHVEAARDAGVHLVFMSGNEMFWRVRLEPSIGPGSVDDRTITCFKETHDGAKTDPSSQWTGTWRDPRFSPPAVGGGDPENRLTGQLFKCINPMGILDGTLTVPSRLSRLRTWRHSSIATLDAGAIGSLGASTLGYEWDVDVDDDNRPGGLVQITETTAAANEVLVDYGSVYTPGRETHHATLYRASSGALVFATGTVQWSFGLDSVHSSDQVPDNRDMQQATMNVLADMGVQPTTPQSDLVASPASDDTLAPVSTITSPVTGDRFAVGDPLVVRGTAVDSGGGVVAGVEVSLDGGSTWRRAVGADTWSYATTIRRDPGDLVIRCRAVDDSANLETPGPGATVEVVAPPLPVTLFPDSWQPAVASTPDTTPVEVGLRVRTREPGVVTALRCYRGPDDLGVLTATLWTRDATVLARATFESPTAPGWQEVAVTPVPLDAGEEVVVSVWRPEGRYGFDAALFTTAFVSWPLEAPADGDDPDGRLAGNGLYRYGQGFPTSSYLATSYGVDLRLDAVEAPSASVDVDPAPDIEMVSPTTAITVRSDRRVDPASVRVELAEASNAPNAVTIATQITISADGRDIRADPERTLTPGSRWRATVTATTLDGAAVARSWEFRIAPDAGGFPTSLVDSSVTPTLIATEDTAAVEVGVRVRCDVDAVIRAVRSWIPPSCPGPVTARIWRRDGSLAATAVLSATGSSATQGWGWRQVAISPPVPVAAGELVTVSCHHPGGRYPAIPGALGTEEIARGPLHAPTGSAVGGNGVYRYGEAQMPTSSYISTWYLTDLIVDAAPTSSSVTLVDIDPGDGVWAVDPGATITAAVSGPVDPATTRLVVTTPMGDHPGTTTSDPTATIWQWRGETPLPDGVRCRATLEARTPAGARIDPAPSWEFVTASLPGRSPATLRISTESPAILAAADTAAVELGCVWRCERDATAVAVRFFKGPGNEGPHVGRLWTHDGTLLASCVFATETAQGWQQAPLDRPVAVTAGTRYVVSYHAPRGRYSATVGTFATEALHRAPLTAPASTPSSGNGRYAYGPGGFPNQTFSATDYGVDVVVEFPDDSSTLTVTGTAPASGSTEVATTARIAVRFDRDVDPATGTVDVESSTGELVLASLTRGDSPDELMVTTAIELPRAALITVDLRDVRGRDGSRLLGDVSWSFTTADGVAGTAFGVFDPTQRPALASADDTATVELGLAFRSSEPGDVLGVRCYLGPGNTGPHRGRLWSLDGTLLAETPDITTVGEGWTILSFPTAVVLAPGDTVVVSYLAPRGGYAFDAGRHGSDVVNGPLTAPADSPSVPNGRFRYGGGFPDTSFFASGYGVDVVWRPTTTSTTTAS